ncbi:HNH endonuclease signature motif containing protein, partial [Escherichia coli O8:H19]
TNRSPSMLLTDLLHGNTHRQRITHETGWNVHHKVKKVMGGGEELSNLVLLHPNCHRQLHSCEAGSLKKGL